MDKFVSFIHNSPPDTVLRRVPRSLGSPPVLQQLPCLMCESSICLIELKRDVFQYCLYESITIMSLL